MIKAVFLDVDGTLVSFKTHKIPESAKLAVETARKNGVKVVIASGRQTLVEQERAAFSELEFDGYIGINGQICHTPGGELIYTLPLDENDVSEVLARCERLGFPCLVVGIDRTRVTMVDSRVENFQNKLDIPMPKVLKEGELEGGVFSLMPYIYPEEEEAVLGGLKKCMSARWSPYATDVIPAAGGKEKGVELFLQRFGIDRADSMALGDGENDIGMIKYAGVGVAMGGGRPLTLAAADFVAPCPEEDGLYYTFKKYNII